MEARQRDVTRYEGTEPGQRLRGQRSTSAAAAGPGAAAARRPRQRGGGGGRAGPHYKSRQAARAPPAPGEAVAGPGEGKGGEAKGGEAMPATGSEAEEGGGEGAGPGASPAGEQPGPCSPKLCGYLQKLSGKGPLRGFRSRWFVFDPRRCYLYYFKGPQEALPLGHLDIASACFSYHQPEAGAAAGDEGAAFEVHSPGGAVAVLKVGPGAPCAARPARPGPAPRLPAAGLGLLL